MSAVRTKLLTIGLLTLLAGGCCGPEPKSFNVRVSIDQDTWRRAGATQVPNYRFEVDLVAVNPSEKGKLESYPVDQYFTPNDQRRNDAERHTLRFEAGNSQPQLLPRDHAIWKTWMSKGADHLIVMSNLQGVQVQQGAEDPRRIVLPLACNAWKTKDNTLEIQVRSSTIVNTTERKPADQGMFE